jgi:hypothetical protein
MEFFIPCKCPICEHINVGRADERTGQAVILCDTDQGGCDNYFAIVWVVQSQVTVYRLEEVVS